MRAVIEAAREEDEDEFQHVYRGVPKDDDNGAVIKRSWIMAALDAHVVLGIEPTGRKRIGFDVADDGNDKCAQIASHGPLAFWGEEWKAEEHELLKSSTRVWNKAIELEAEVVYDNIGVGAQVGAKINELNEGSPTKIAHIGFNAGDKVNRPKDIYGSTKKTNKDMFANLKAQEWWGVADRLRNTYNAVKGGAQFDKSEMIFISSDMPNLTKLIDELATPKRDYDTTGKVKVESKKDLAKKNREGGPKPSPNLADGFIMAFCEYRPEGYDYTAALANAL
jgi:phage terminase large subunit